MKRRLINSVCGVGSTGRMRKDFAREYEASDWKAGTAYGYMQRSQMAEKTSSE